MRQMSYQYKKIKEEILKINNNIIYVTDVLIKYLYSKKKNNKKITLWECFGDIILENLKNNLTKGFKKQAIECERCGKLIEKTSERTKYCSTCAKEIEKENHKKRNKKWYKNKIRTI